ncbi:MULTISPECIES: signal recognition particle-docking protein FtsY [unclassified Avibacterium]|uniref:signal recognition particle-docking protein FtsY n=1 Tax=unclassified Avibacterium TaxID=2685287 RepID=UPI002026D2E4|nr:MULTISPECIES: signal recognition particle-docking protein FtsY [unclassified Avibacterium]MCW9698874.1 signal recognition particle-docking protein FtsY [Avibacterium sp. 20-129]URL06910.1 signal recognition particle-docking protein FtsY [Avibacterium sp. 21-595]
MAEKNKKGGFWSWFGLGKKKEETSNQAEIQKTEIAKQAELPQEQSAVENPDVLAQETKIAEQAVLSQEPSTVQNPDVLAQETKNAEQAELPQEPSAVQNADVLAQETKIAEQAVLSQEQSAVEDPDLLAQETESAEQAELSQEPSAVQNPDVLAQETESAEQAELPQESSAVENADVLAQETETAEQSGLPQEPSAVENADVLAQETEIAEQAVLSQEQNAVQNTDISTQEKPSEGGFFSRLVKGLIRTKQNIGSGFFGLFSGKKIDDDLFEELEEQLLIADIGMPTTTKIINNLTQHASRKQLKDADLLYQQLKVELAEIIKPVAQPLEIDHSKKPYVILMVGVNGVGKTTTIGKLARQFQMQGKSVMLAAGDTFRAAAVEQLQVWGERNNIPVVAQSTGADSASVIYDAMQSAAARNIDILIADTAGRLQNKNNLMDELKKIVRVMKKYDETAPHEIMLTLDAGTGQNAISQAKLFNEAVGLTGISLTKLDGTAKGGVIFAIADQFKLPIRYIGIGEKIEDLRPFKADEFIEALFNTETTHH